MITAVNKDGSIKRELVFNETILMVDKYDALTFEVKNERFGMSIKFHFTFSDTGEKYGSDGNLSDDGNEVFLTLHNWYSAYRVENIDPIELDLISGHRIWLKYGTSAEEKPDFRMFHLTIWGEFKS